MKRALVIACLSTALLLPATAEAAKARLGGKSSTTSSTEGSGGKGQSLMVVPGAGSAMAGTAKAADHAPTRVPFPPSSAPAPAPALMQLTVNDASKIWCRSEVVVGGFCVLN
ncbi:hypothetical protein [Bosea sp. 124]|uniref:hypothetical protein n=1 Tax=Bosea sp. 124 TaxID=2135642 RepID=UPI000D3A81DB|nr:hypothetical protein [Bosea sp. 124]PTM42172.1 hypothetical protein C8D03_3752 [Bosea sp. 124]